MSPAFEARWISRQRAEEAKRKGTLGQAMLLETFNGYILVELVGGSLADGRTLSAEEADYELTPVWYTGPKTKLRAARQRLGLTIEEPATASRL